MTDSSALADALVPPFDTKIAVIVRDDLAAWQRLNVTAFLSAGIAAANPHLIGAPYQDGDGSTYLPLLGMPILVFEATIETLRSIRERAVGRKLSTAIYTSDMFSTGHDAANRAMTVTVPAAELDLVGLALHGAKNPVDRTVKGARLHP